MAWTNPLSGVVTSGFNLSRRHPVTGRVQAHRGTDIAPRAGNTLIGAINDGTVVGVRTGRRRGSSATNTFSTPHGTMWFGTGNAVLIRHSGSYSNVYSYYGHLASVAVSPGQSVSAGQAIGRVGATGVVTGVHLHLEILIGGWNHVNPQHWLKTYHGVSLGYGRTSISTGPTIPPTAYPSVQMRATPLVFTLKLPLPRF